MAFPNTPAVPPHALTRDIGEKLSGLDKVYIDGKLVSELPRQGEMTFEVEPYTGVTTSVKYSYEIAAYIDDNMAFPSLPHKMIPLMRVDITGSYTDAQMKQRFSELLDRLSNVVSIRVAFILLGGVFALFAAIVAVLYVMNRGKRNQPALLEDEPDTTNKTKVNSDSAALAADKMQ